MPYFAGYIFISWIHRLTRPKDLAVCSPAASQIPSNHPWSLQAQVQVQPQVFLTEVKALQYLSHNHGHKAAFKRENPLTCALCKKKQGGQFFYQQNTQPRSFRWKDSFIVINNVIKHAQARLSHQYTSVVLWWRQSALYYFQISENGISLFFF